MERAITRRIHKVIYGPSPEFCEVILDDGSRLGGVEMLNPHEADNYTLCRVSLTVVLYKD